MSEQQMQFEVDWSPAEDVPAEFVNQYAVQVGSAAGPQQTPDGIYLTVGVIMPPIFLGTPDQVSRQIEAHSKSLPVHNPRRFVMSIDHARELVDGLRTVLQQLDEAGVKSPGTAGS